MGELQWQHNPDWFQVLATGSTFVKKLLSVAAAEIPDRSGMIFELMSFVNSDLRDFIKFRLTDWAYN